MSRSEVKIGTAGKQRQAFEAAGEALKNGGFRKELYGNEPVWRKGILIAALYAKLAYLEGEMQVWVWSTEPGSARELDLQEMGLLPRKELLGLLMAITQSQAVFGEPKQKKPSTAPVAAAPEEKQEPPRQTLPGKLKPLGRTGMLYTPLTKRAMQICFQAHEHQVDKSGLPYVFHPFHVAEMLETEEEICTALLHDVVEDTEWTFKDLREQGIPEPVLEALEIMTHDKSEAYMDYILRIRSNPIARRVKLADLAHNSDPARLERQTPASEARRQKYAIARAILEDDYYDRVLGHFRKRIPLDLERYYFLSVFYDKEGNVLKYALDEEAASDRHYEFDARGGQCLKEHFGSDRSLPEELSDLLKQGDKAGALFLLRKLSIGWKEYHYG